MKQRMVKKVTGDAALIKKINTSIVLESVVQHSPISRAAISERTGLNKATVSSLISDLIGSHLVIEIGMGESSGGRKPVMLLFNKDAGYAIGIDLGVDYVRGIAADLEGHVVAHSESSYDSQKLDDVLAILYRCIDELIASAPSSPYGIVGIGIGVPGIVDQEGVLLFAPNLEWAHVPLRDLVEARYQVPVTIDNEANAGAQGEQKYGAGRGIANQIYVSAGAGIGTGIIIDTQLYKGSSGFSGELGHLSIALDGPVCRCGNKGCWELFASEQALLARAVPFGWDSTEAVMDAAAAGDEHAVKLLDSVGSYLGIGIANIVNVFNPDAVIIGNTLSLAEPWLRTSVAETAKRRSLPFHRDRLEIRYAELGASSAVRGAAYYAINRFLKRMKSGS